MPQSLPVLGPEPNMVQGRQAHFAFGPANFFMDDTVFLYLPWAICYQLIVLSHVNRRSRADPFADFCLSSQNLPAEMILQPFFQARNLFHLFYRPGIFPRETIVQGVIQKNSRLHP